MLEKYIINCIRLAWLVQADAEYEYVYDADHKSKPKGPGWTKTESGWSKNVSDDKSNSSIKRKQKGVTLHKSLHYLEVGKDPKYKYHVFFSKKSIKDVMDSGHFSVISAGKNPELEKGIPKTYFTERHKMLKDELEKNKIPFTECIGKYKGIEHSLIIPHDYRIKIDTEEKHLMVHHGAATKEEYDFIDKLGKKYNQQSVLHGNKKKFELHFTAGKNKGHKCGGEGWKEVPLAKDFYTEVKLTKDQITKVSMDIHECFEKGYL